MEVKPVGNIIASMVCDPAIVPLDSSTVCTVHLGLRSANTVTLNLKEVDFGGKKVWPDGPSSVRVNRQTVTLTPTNMQEDLTIIITINDELANYYFEKKPLGWGSYSDRLVGYSYLIKAVFSGGVASSDIVEIRDRSPSLGEKVETLTKGGSIAQYVLEKVAKHAGQLETVASGSLGKATVVVSKFFGVLGWLLTARDVINWLRAPTPSDGDNNNVIGG
ncbi:hypothetical protein [Thermococcus celer]|nr:hypothetical protein [Thermococcus celer]